MTLREDPERSGTLFRSRRKQRSPNSSVEGEVVPVRLRCCLAVRPRISRLSPKWNKIGTASGCCHITHNWRDRPSVSRGYRQSHRINGDRQRAAGGSSAERKRPQRPAFASLTRTSPSSPSSETCFVGTGTTGLRPEEGGSESFAVEPWSRRCRAASESPENGGDRGERRLERHYGFSAERQGSPDSRDSRDRACRGAKKRRWKRALVRSGRATNPGRASMTFSRRQEKWRTAARTRGCRRQRRSQRWAAPAPTASGLTPFPAPSELLGKWAPPSPRALRSTESGVASYQVPQRLPFEPRPIAGARSCRCCQRPSAR